MLLDAAANGKPALLLQNINSSAIVSAVMNTAASEVPSETALQRAIRLIGGQGVLASHIEITQGAISQWVRGHRRIPAERAVQIEELTKGQVTRFDLRPDFPWVRRDPPKQEAA